MHLFWKQNLTLENSVFDLIQQEKKLGSQHFTLGYAASLITQNTVKLT